VKQKAADGVFPFALVLGGNKGNVVRTGKLEIETEYQLGSVSVCGVDSS
jgi:hypothetical protein